MTTSDLAQFAAAVLPSGVAVLTFAALILAVRAGSWLARRALDRHRGR